MTDIRNHKDSRTLWYFWRFTEMLSRIQNIVCEMDAKGRTPEWYRENHRTPWVTDSHILDSSIGIRCDVSWRD